MASPKTHRFVAENNATRYSDSTTLPTVAQNKQETVRQVSDQLYHDVGPPLLMRHQEKEKCDGNDYSSGAGGIRCRFDCRGLACTGDVRLLILEGIIMGEQNIATTIQNHSIEIIDGYLTINGDGQALNPDETAQLLETLLIWKYGFEEISSERLEDEAFF